MPSQVHRDDRHPQSQPNPAQPDARKPRRPLVAPDGSAAEDPYPLSKEHLGGYSIVDVVSRAEALEWAAKFTVACRCAHDVRELMNDPGVWQPHTPFVQKLFSDM